MTQSIPLFMKKCARPPTGLRRSLLLLCLFGVLFPSNLAQDNSTHNDPSSTNFTTSTNSNSTAQPSTFPTSNTIPPSISSTCQAYLTHLNSHDKVKACTAPLLKATASISAGGGAQAIKADQLKSAFDGMCHNATGCEPAVIHNILNHLAGNCSQELEAGQSSVRAIYDVMYILTPYRVAMCSKDPSTGAYCPSVIASAVVNGTNSKSGGSNKVMSPGDFGAMVSSVLQPDKLVVQNNAASNHLRRRADSMNSTLNNSTSSQSAGNTTATESAARVGYNPNSDAFTTTNLAFLFLNPSLSQGALCTPCTQSVLAAYIGFEQSNPHYGGLSTSGYLSGQLKLWNGIKDRCGQKFVEAIETDAGVMSSLTTTGAAIKRTITGQEGALKQIFSSLVLMGVMKILLV